MTRYVRPMEGNPQRPVRINTLVFSPDGQTIVVGRENGDIYRFDAQNLTTVRPVKLATLPDQGPVEFLTYSPDGKWLAASIISKKAISSIQKRSLATWSCGRCPGKISRWQVPGCIFPWRSARIAAGSRMRGGRSVISSRTWPISNCVRRNWRAGAALSSTRLFP